MGLGHGRVRRRPDGGRKKRALIFWFLWCRVTAVLDTKYKTPNKASNADISQVATYAQAKDSQQAILIYPLPLAQPLNVHLHGLQIRSLSFPVSGNLDEAGQHFLTNLLSNFSPYC